MKLCKDCKHYWPDPDFKNEAKQVKYAQCALKVRMEPDLVGGGLVESDSGEEYCTVQRNMGLITQIVFNACGRRGRYWEPK